MGSKGWWHNSVDQDRKGPSRNNLMALDAVVAHVFRECEYHACHNPLPPESRVSRRFCCKRCAWRARNERVRGKVSRIYTGNCPGCGGFVDRSDTAGGQRRWCSRYCSNVNHPSKKKRVKKFRASHCKFCRKPLPDDRHPLRRYCDAVCRTAQAQRKKIFEQGLN